MSGYIMGLRKEVGHRPLLQVGASVIIEDREGRILLQKRADTHSWAYHGGSVELDEAVEETARRELFEETGLRAESLEFFGLFSGPELHFTYPNGDEVSCIDVVYICRDWSGEMKADPGEVDELRFFRADELPDDISSPTWPGIRKWRDMKLSSNRFSESRSE